MLDLGVEEYERDLFFDPQTSGGLLISLDPEPAGELLSRLREDGTALPCAVIGRVLERQEKAVILKP